MTREPTTLPRVTAGITFALGAIVFITTINVIGTNSGYWYVSLVIFAPSVLTAGGVLLTRARTPAFRFAVACCAFVCFASLFEIIVMGGETIAPTGGFAIAGAVGIGWFAQIFPALGAAAAGFVSRYGQTVPSRRAGD